MQSMTGYGRCQIERDGREMTVEVKSVNHRFLDISYRLARHLTFLDDALRKGVSARLSRGHVDVFVNYENHRADAREVRVDTALAVAYQSALRELSQALHMEGQISVQDYARLPDVLTVPLLIAGFFCSAADLGIVAPFDSATGALAGFLLPTVTAAVMTPFFPRSLGGGDYKMLTALGAWLGFINLVIVILTSVVYFALIAFGRRKKEGPYGASLFLGVLTVLILLHFETLRFLLILI